MNAASSRGRPSRCVRPPKGRGSFTSGVSARPCDRKHHNRGMQLDFVLALFGPTASGKTAVAEDLASRFPAEPISADSMQAYRGLPILTNQPGAPTRLVGIWELDHEGSVAEYQQLAHAAVDAVLRGGKTPIGGGGTGLYPRGPLAGLGLPPAPAPR